MVPAGSTSRPQTFRLSATTTVSRTRTYFICAHVGREDSSAVHHHDDDYLHPVHALTQGFFWSQHIQMMMSVTDDHSVKWDDGASVRIKGHWKNIKIYFKHDFGFMDSMAYILCAGPVNLCRVILNQKNNTDRKVFTFQLGPVQTTSVI